jgi:hypothetical protein
MGWAARLVVVALLALALPADAADPVPRPGGLSPGWLSKAEREFLEKHWRRAIPPRGPAPARFSPIELSLQPEACGACHPVQFGDWQASLHSKSMGPGVAGQLVEMARREPAAARSCSPCHAPVAEQRPALVDARGVVSNPDFDLALQFPGRHLRDLPRAGPRAFRPAAQGRLDDEPRAARDAPAQWRYADDHLPPG